MAQPQQHLESAGRPESANLQQQQPQINAPTTHSHPPQFPQPPEHSSSLQQHSQTPPIQTSAYQPLWAYGAPPASTQYQVNHFNL